MCKILRWGTQGQGGNAKGVAKKYQSYWLKQPSPQRHEMQSGDLSRALRSICLYFWSRVRWYTEDEAVLVLAQLLCPLVPVGVGHDWVAELNLQIVKFYFILFFGCAGSSFLVWSMSSRCMDSVVAAQRPSYPKACAGFLDQGLKLSSAVRSGLSVTGPWGKSVNFIFNPMISAFFFLFIWIFFISLGSTKPLTVWITRNCGKFWKRWEYQTTWPASWETYMQVRKQQLELDMEQQTGSK